MKYLKAIVMLMFLSSAMIAMEPEAPEGISFNDLPNEIMVSIITKVINAPSLEEALKNIQSMRLVNKRFNALLNDRSFTSFLIRALENRFPMDRNKEKNRILVWKKHQLFQLLDCLPEIASIKNELAFARSEQGDVVFRKKLKDYITRFLFAEIEGDPTARLFYSSVQFFLKNDRPLAQEIAKKYKDTPLKEPNLWEEDFPLKDFPLHAAALNNHTIAADILIRAGTINVNQTNEHAITPLMIASNRGYQEIVDLLLKAGANPNLKAQGEKTALMAAAKIGDDKVVEMLLRAGADPSLKNEKGQTARDLAAMEESGTIVKILDNALEEKEKREMVEKCK